VRYLLAAIVLGVSLAGAVWLHGYRETRHHTFADGGTTTLSVHPSWADPAAVGGAVVGVGLAAAILTARRRNFAKPS